MSKASWRLGLAALALIFTWFTWRGMLWFYSGDDMMNMYFAESLNPWRLGRAQFMIWLPVYRPLGALVYHLFYRVFGFHPLPLYVFCWLLLALNAALSVPFFRAFRIGAAGVLVAATFALVHGNFQDLYLSAGTMYDRFWFLFTVLGLIVYARTDLQRRPRYLMLIALSILSMNAKESGVALPMLLACYECVFVLPEFIATGQWKARLKSIAPLYAVLALLSLLFVFGRVHQTPELAGNAEYAPHLDLVRWFTRLAEYWRILSYQHVPFTALWAGITLFALVGIAVALRNRAMVFGWLFFVITITPVALISSRPGYVLYVPDLGLALYLGALVHQTMNARWQTPAAALFIIAVTIFHVRNWPPPDTPHNPEYQLSTQIFEQYPKLPQGTKFLFTKDNLPPGSWDVTFDLRLMYHDRTIVAHRLGSPGDQQPDPAHPIHYDHIFEQESGMYRELDNRDYKESIRMHLVRDYAPGREMDFSRKDYITYLVSGVAAGDTSNPTRWTMPRASFKFDIFPAAALFTAKFWVPDFVAKSGARTLHILVNGHNIGDHPLAHDGMNDIALPVQPETITPNGLTIVEMNVENPYKDPSGEALGVVLLRAGFEYRPH